jgi:membrane protein implicated in regulation of membrane protease activity
VIITEETPMAIIFTCTGGVLGLMAAIAALVAGSGLLAALALWSAAGVAFTLIGLALATMPRRGPEPLRQAA